MFVGKALLVGVVSGYDVAKALTHLTGQALYQRLLSLGHQLESCPEDLDAMYEELDARCNKACHSVSGLVTSESVEEHRKWLTVSMHMSLSVKISQHCTKARCRKY
jgi:hypothetical protein